MSESTVAIRHAKSLIDLAKEKNVVDAVYDDMVFFKATSDENRGLLLALKSPVVRHEKKMGILKGVFEDKVNPVTYTIFKIITKKNREAIIFAIAEEYIKLYDDQKGIVKAQVTSAVSLTTELKAAFSEVVANATGRTVQLEDKIDATLIGGYVLRVGDRQIDASIRKSLNDLKISLLK